MASVTIQPTYTVQYMHDEFTTVLLGLKVLAGQDISTITGRDPGEVRNAAADLADSMIHQRKKYLEHLTQQAEKSWNGPLTSEDAATEKGVGK